MAGWKAAGFAFATGPSRWDRDAHDKISAWRQCIQRQPENTTGTDAAAMAAGSIRACKVQEAALYAAIGPWYSDKSADGLIADLRQSVVSSKSIFAESNVLAAKQKAKEADDDRRWQAIEHINLQPNQVHTAYEWCISSPWDGAHRNIQYFSSIFAVRMPNLEPLDEAGYSRLNVEAPSGRGGRFRAYFNQMNRESEMMLTFCFRSPTEAEASTDKRASMSRGTQKNSKTVQDTAWKP